MSEPADPAPTEGLEVPPSALRTEGPGGIVPPTQVGPPPSSSPPDTLPEVPGYLTIQALGRGGMGEVYEAEQLEPVRRRVALKVIRAGMHSAEVIARFEGERQALALMDHSSIAQVFDAGITAEGRPYLAMELVRGQDLTRFCASRKLSIRGRIRLFLQICAAVQHAHQKGIIHRDLKPSNILVKLEDDRPVPRIIDFGVAKAISVPLTDTAVETVFGQVLGTPEFMSPEQADRGEADVDTRTDVYALGAILYFLLCGALPFASEDLRSGGADEMRRRIREDDPPLPSERIELEGPRAERVASERGREPRDLRKCLKGDLDWIVVRAMEKRRSRRYATVGELADDLNAYLDHLPIRAARPSPGYRLQKFVKRHRIATVVGSAASLLVLTSAILLVIFNARLAAERDRAEVEARTAEEVADFLVDLFENGRPQSLRTANLTVREVLDDGARQLDERLEEQPLLRARMMDVIGRSYLGLGATDSAAPLFEGAYDLRQRELDPRHADLATSLFFLAAIEGVRGHYSEHEKLARQATELRTEALGPDHPLTAESIRSLGWALMKQDRHEEARDALRRAYEIRRGALDPEDPDLAESLYDLGTVSWHLGDYAAAESWLRQSETAMEVALGSDHLRLTRVLDAQGALLRTLGRGEEAARALRRSAQILEATGHDKTERYVNTMNTLGVLVSETGDLENGIRILERARDTHLELFGEIHPTTGQILGNLAWALHQAGEVDRSRELFGRALRISEEALGDDHRKIATLRNDFARLLLDLGELDQALAQAERALEIVESIFGGDHPRVSSILEVMGRIQARAGDLDSARRSWTRALEVRTRSLGDDHASLTGLRELLDSLETTDPG